MIAIGTVHWVSVQHGRHRLVDGPEGFEDGTPAFLAAAAVAPALEAIRGAGRERLARHLACLTSRLLAGLGSLRHDNGLRMIQVHGPEDGTDRGATVAISLRDRNGRAIPYWHVEHAARDAGIAIRGGCFCNPGCAEAAFAFPDAETRACLDQLGDAFTAPGFAACLGDRSVGAIRISMGLGTITADVDRFVGLAAAFADQRATA